MGLGLIEAYLEGRCGLGLSPHCQGLEVRGLWQREGGASGRMPKPMLAQQPQGSRESKRPTVPLGRLYPFPHRQCSFGSRGAA